jgi:PiT family inorganic phosphate transporter
VTSRESAGAEVSRFLKAHGEPTEATYAALESLTAEISETLRGRGSMAEIADGERGRLRSNVYLVTEAMAHMDTAGTAAPRAELQRLVRFIPLWVKLAVALALGLGTTIGWKRIVVTVGEKIGKTHLSYAQGAAAEMVAAATIAAADIGGWPVSTTHVLSSGVAGTMAANHSGLQMNTMRNLLLAWVLTLPVCVFLGAMLFALGINIVVSLGLR